MDESAVSLALRNRARTLVVKTTGLTNLEQTATGFKRSAGSFAADGFIVGMEVTPVGFPANVLGSVEAVSATDLTVAGGVRTAVVEGPNRSVSVLLPGIQGWEGRPITPKAGEHYLVEEFSPSTSDLRTGMASAGTLEDLGDYFLTWYMPTTIGNINGVGVKALRMSVKALKDLFPAGLVLAVGDGTFVRVRTKPAPATAQVVPLNGWSALQLKVPWRVLSQNAVIP